MEEVKESEGPGEVSDTGNVPADPTIERVEPIWWKYKGSQEGGGRMFCPGDEK